MSILASLLKDIFSQKQRAQIAENSPVHDAQELYLDLMKRCLMNYIYDDDVDQMRGEHELNSQSGKLAFVSGVHADPERKYYGGIWPSKAHTMIGMPRLNDLQKCIVDILSNGIPGDLAETGVWRGGATIFMRAVLKAYGVTDRLVWVADSFEGLPPASRDKYPYDSALDLHLFEDLAVGIDQVVKNFDRYGLLDEQVKFLKGWFSDTLPSAPIDKLAILRLDGDHYESTMDALVHLYPKLSVGGYLLIDDFNAVEGCNLAVQAYREKHHIADQIIALPGSGAHWKRGSS